MYWDHAPHVPSPNDRTIIKCRICGWTSRELTIQELRDLGYPRWCHNCDAKATLFVTFAPRDREQALREIARQGPRSHGLTVGLTMTRRFG